MMEFKVIDGSALPFKAGAIAAELRDCEKQIIDNESAGIKGRWHFGKVLLRHRKGKLLPRGMLKEICDEFKLSRSEVLHRACLAEKYPTLEQLSNGVRQLPTWHQMTHCGLYEKRAAKAKPKPSADKFITRALTTFKSLRKPSSARIDDLLRLRSEIDRLIKEAQ